MDQIFAQTSVEFAFVALCHPFEGQRILDRERRDGSANPWLRTL